MSSEFLRSGNGSDLDQVRLVGLAATGYHGVLAQERREGQVFGADVVVHVDTRDAARSDDLTRTVDYADLALRVEAVLVGAPVALLETLAQQIADVALGMPGVEIVDVVVHKPQAPLGVPFDDVQVAIRRYRPPVEAPPPAATVVIDDVDEPADVDEPQPVQADVVVVPDALELDDVDGPDALDLAVPESDAREPVVVEPADLAVEPADIGVEPTDLVVEPADIGVETETRVFGTVTPVGGAVPADGADLDLRPTAPVDVVLALGGNVGQVRATLRRAIAELAAEPGMAVVTVSPLARTAAVGPEQDDYFNAVVLGRTELSPREVLALAQRIEAAHGRVRGERWGPRTLDIDVITIDGVVAADPQLTLPHPRANERAFVLVPWAQIAPDAVLPGRGGGPVAVLAETAPDRDGVRWLALDWFDVVAIEELDAAPAVQAPPGPAL